MAAVAAIYATRGGGRSMDGRRGVWGGSGRSHGRHAHVPDDIIDQLMRSVLDAVEEGWPFLTWPNLQHPNVRG